MKKLSLFKNFPKVSTEKFLFEVALKVHFQPLMQPQKEIPIKILIKIHENLTDF